MMLPATGDKRKKKSDKYRGPRRSGWAGAVSGGQGQYWVSRGSISCYTTKSQIFGILNNLCKMLFLLVEQKKKIGIVSCRTSEKTCVLSFIDL